MAHFSDVHLGPLALSDVFAGFRLKQLIGGLSWLRRRKIHLPQIAEAMLADIAREQPDHIAFTGDLINIAAHSEFLRGRQWLEKVGPPDIVSFTPGNHDAYVPVSFENGLAHWQPWFTGDAKKSDQFPYLRLRRNVALIGLSTAQPQNLYRANGTLGEAQRNALRLLLQDMRLKGFCRVVMIHHPPAPGLAMGARALTDADELAQILKAEGAELVIHGHNHHAMHTWLEGVGGPIPVIGVASASGSARHGEPAQWNLYCISRQKGQWQITLEPHRWNPSLQAFQRGDSLALNPEAP